jgi:hypothetical protein
MHAVEIVRTRKSGISRSATRAASLSRATRRPTRMSPMTAAAARIPKNTPRKTFSVDCPRAFTSNTLPFPMEIGRTFYSSAAFLFLIRCVFGACQKSSYSFQHASLVSNFPIQCGQVLTPFLDPMADEEEFDQHQNTDYKKDQVSHYCFLFSFFFDLGCRDFLRAFSASAWELSDCGSSPPLLRHDAG